LDFRQEKAKGELQPSRASESAEACNLSSVIPPKEIVVWHQSMFGRQSSSKKQTIHHHRKSTKRKSIEPRKRILIIEWIMGGGHLASAEGCMNGKRGKIQKPQAQTDKRNPKPPSVRKQKVPKMETQPKGNSS